jgi:hypothetical protein
MKNIIQQLQDFIGYLGDARTIKLVTEKTCAEVIDTPQIFVENQIKLISKHKGIEISNDFHYFFNISDLSGCWSFTNKNNDFIYGGFLFNGLSESLAQDSDFWDVYNSINKHEPSERESGFLKKLNWFEKQAWGDDGKFGCFLREPGNFPLKIYFYDSGAYFPMITSLEEYFDAMISSCAVRGWQYFYINFPDEFPNLKEVNKEKILKELELTVKLLPILFPDRDFSFHQKRYEEIEIKLK